MRSLPGESPDADVSVLVQELYQDVHLMPLLRRLMQISCRLTEAVGGSISIVDRPGQRYTKISERGTACRLGQSFSSNEGVTGRVMGSRRPVVLGSYRDVAAGHLAAGHPAGDGAVAAIPIWWRGDVVGANVVFAGRSRPFSAAEVDQLEILTQLVAPALVMAAQRDLSLSYLATTRSSERYHVLAEEPSSARSDAVMVSAAEAALELAALGERAGVFRSQTGERLYVAVLRQGEGLPRLMPGPSDDLRELDGPSPPRGPRELGDGAGSEAAGPPRAAEHKGSPPPFSPREGQVVALLARGLSDRSVARELLISQKTVEKHVGAVLRKTGTTSRTAAVMRALEEGWFVASPLAFEPRSSLPAG